VDLKRSVYTSPVTWWPGSILSEPVRNDAAPFLTTWVAKGSAIIAASTERLVSAAT
jgi:hypothetical protein